MFSTIVSILGWIALAALAVSIIGSIILYIGLSKEDPRIKSIGGLIQFLGARPLFIVGPIWFVCWIISLFV